MYLLCKLLFVVPKTMKHHSFMLARPPAVRSDAYCVAFAVFIIGVINTLPAFAQDTSTCKQLEVLFASADSVCVVLAQSAKRDTATMQHLHRLTEQMHSTAQTCGLRLTAMMSKAAASAAKHLWASANILLFRMGVRDTRAFITEARRYYGLRQ